MEADAAKAGLVETDAGEGREPEEGEVDAASVASDGADDRSIDTEVTPVTAMVLYAQYGIRVAATLGCRTRQKAPSQCRRDIRIDAPVIRPVALHAGGVHLPPSASRPLPHRFRRASPSRRPPQLPPPHSQMPDGLHLVVLVARHDVEGEMDGASAPPAMGRPLDAARSTLRGHMLNMMNVSGRLRLPLRRCSCLPAVSIHVQLGC